MYRLYLKHKDNDLLYLIPLVILAQLKFVGYIVRFLSRGATLPYSEDSVWYINYAGAFIANLMDGLDINDTLYFGYNSLLATLLAIFGNTTAIVITQAITAGFAVILVYKIACLLFNRNTAIIASLFYIWNWDITLWTLYILSDSFFVSLLLLCTYLLLMATGTGEKLHRRLFVFTALYMMVFRPTGIAIAFVMFIYLLLALPRATLWAFIKRYYKAAIVFVAIAVGALIYVYTDAKMELLVESIRFNVKKVLYNVYAKGWIFDKPTVHDHFFRPNYTIDVCNSLAISFIYNNWADVSIIYLKRAMAFLGRWVLAMDVGSAKGIFITIGHGLPTLMFICGTVAAVINGLFRRASILWLIVIAIAAFCIGIFIDWMYRYKLPAIPFIIIIVAYGTERTLNGMRRFGKKVWRC